MNKELQYKMLGDYPGLSRTIQRIDDLIEIEYNFQYSNEIGIRFRNHFTDAGQENAYLKEYYATGGQDPDREYSRKEQYQSWVQLLRDITAGRLVLPANRNAYVCAISKKGLKRMLTYAEQSLLDALDKQELTD